MPLSLNVSHSKKVGLPNYGSQGACCSLGIELDGSLLRDDPKKFRHEVREAFIACREAVEEELARSPAEQPVAVPQDHGGWPSRPTVPYWHTYPGTQKPRLGYSKRCRWKTAKCASYGELKLLIALVQ